MTSSSVCFLISLTSCAPADARLGTALLRRRSGESKELERIETEAQLSGQHDQRSVGDVT